MTDLSFQLGLLKGYVLACEPPQEILTAIDRLREHVAGGSESQAKKLAKAIVETSAKAPSHDESRFVAPETAQGEANEESGGGVSSQKDKNASVSTGGAALKEKRAPGKGMWMPEEKQQLLSMKQAGAAVKDIAVALGKTVSQCYQMIHRLKHQAEKPDDASVMEELHTDVKPAEKPRMKFKKVKCKDSWGNENERQVPVPLGKYKDAETGAKVTTYPPGYAYGTGPQRNISVKGGA